MSDKAIKDYGVSEITVRGQRGMAALGLFIAELNKELAWGASVDLTGYSLRDKGDEWLLVVTGLHRKRAVVCFVGGREPLECYRNLWYLLHKGALAWRDDKYRQ